MAAVSQLSNGHIILPGFDFDAPQSMWSHLLSDRATEDHPQFRLAKVIETVAPIRQSFKLDKRILTPTDPPDLA